MRVVISQSMYFPWVGFLEQLRLADVFVVYDDVQFSKGSFTNRVQIKTAAGARWLTVPLPYLHLGKRINAVLLDNQRDWRGEHREQLTRAYGAAPYIDEMLALLAYVFDRPFANLSELSHASTTALANYFGLFDHLKRYNSLDLNVHGKGSQRVLDIVQAVGGTEYITGLGALKYLDHEAFERAGIEVRYMNYLKLSYPQLHGNFDPYVSALDLVANCGREGAQYMKSQTSHWKEFINEST
jgi:hypothetical protein